MATTVTALIIGARGFIGYSLLRTLSQQGVKVIATTRETLMPPPLPNVVWHKLQSNSVESWHGLFKEKIDHIYHLGWSTIPRTANADPAGDITSNLLSTLYLLDAIKLSGQAPRLVYASSGGTVYGEATIVPIPETHILQPISAYGISKATAEQYIALYQRMHGLDAVSLRIGNPYGPGQDVSRAFGAVTTFTMRAMQNEVIEIYGDGSTVRDYLYIDDLIDALIMAANKNGVFGSINIGSGKGISLNNIVERLSVILGRPVKVTYYTARSFDVPTSVLDINRAQKELGWRPAIDFDAGIKRLLRAL